MSLRLDMKWAMLPGSSDGEEDFDVLEPMSWPVESCSPIGTGASSPVQGTLLVFRCTRCTAINTFMGWRRLLQYMECVFNSAFMKRRGFDG